MNLYELGIRVRCSRKDHKLTQEKLAELINVSPHYIYEIEKGMKAMSIYVLVDLALALNTSADYLLFGKSSNPLNINDCKNTGIDALELQLQSLTPKKRETISDLLSVLLPKLK